LKISLGSENSDHETNIFLKKISGGEKYYVPLLIILTLVADLPGFIKIGSVIRGWDGCDLGSIARNYYLHGFKLLYPQIDWGGNGPGYVEMQFPIIPYLTALLYKVFGMHEQLAIILPFLSGVGTVIAVYVFGRHLYGSATGVFAGSFVALSPWWSWQTTIFNGDPAMIFCGVVGLYYFVRWTETEEGTHYWLSALFVSLSILIKLPALYLGFPLLFLWLVKYRLSAIREVKFWIFGLVVLLPPFLWYYHAYLLYVEFGNTFGILAGGYRKFATLSLFLTREYYILFFGHLAFFILTPVVALCFLYGMLRIDHPTGLNGVRVWCAGVFLFQIVSGTTTSGQYLIPILPPAAIIGARGLSLILSKISGVWKLGKFMQRHLVLICAAIVLLFAANYVKYFSTLKYLDSLEGERKEIGSLVNEKTSPGSLIVVASTHSDEWKVDSPKKLDTPSQMFYYSDRKGWYTTMRWLTAGLIERYRNQGAAYFLVPIEVQGFVTKNPVYEYLSDHYPELVHTKECLLFDIRTRTR
jgi:Dolichyl-phosphate-mannose-protein mannosyltransferase